LSFLAVGKSTLTKLKIYSIANARSSHVNNVTFI